MKKMHKILAGMMMLLVALVVVACENEEAPVVVEEPITVEESLNGHWELTDALINDRPFEEVVAELDSQFGSADTAANPEEIRAEADYYFNEGELTIILSNGEQVTADYDVVNTDEENHSLSIEYTVNTEPVELTVSELIVFDDATRQSLSSTASMKELIFNTDPEETASGFDQMQEGLAQNIAREVLEDMEYKYTLAYVDDAAPPAADTKDSSQ